VGSSATELKAWLNALGYTAYRYEHGRLSVVPDDEVHSLDNLLLVYDAKRASLSRYFPA
jgi:hypothetical protein